MGRVYWSRDFREGAQIRAETEVLAAWRMDREAQEARRVRSARGRSDWARTAAPAQREFGATDLARSIRRTSMVFTASAML
jgi:hypothetical protein